jgi:hypothetical protein
LLKESGDEVVEEAEEIEEALWFEESDDEEDAEAELGEASNDEDAEVELGEASDDDDEISDGYDGYDRCDGEEEEDSISAGEDEMENMSD